MESKLQELTQKLYQDGIEKANQEAKAIIEKAKEEAKKILDNAEKEAAAKKSGSEKEAEQLILKTKSEIKVAGEQAISLLQQEITSILSKNTLSAEVAEAVNNKELIVHVIKEIAGKWNASGPIDLNVILPTKMKEDFEIFFRKEAADLLKRGIELKFEDRMNGGFKISPKDNSFLLSFMEEDFVNFFQSFLRPKAKEILFPGA